MALAVSAFFGHHKTTSTVSDAWCINHHQHLCGHPLDKLLLGCRMHIIFSGDFWPMLFTHRHSVGTVGAMGEEDEEPWVIGMGHWTERLVGSAGGCQLNLSDFVEIWRVWGGLLLCEILYIEIYRIDYTSDKSDLMYLDVEIEVPGAQNLSRLLVENLDVFFGGTSSLETWINLQLCQAQGFHWIKGTVGSTHPTNQRFSRTLLEHGFFKWFWHPQTTMGTPETIRNPLNLGWDPWCLWIFPWSWCWNREVGEPRRHAAIGREISVIHISPWGLRWRCHLSFSGSWKR